MIFSRGKDADFEDEVEEEEIPKRKFRDLRPENRRARKEPPKPWGKKERLIVLIILLVTVLTSGILALTARNFKLPNFPKIGIPNLSNFNIFKEQVIIVGNKGTKVNLAKIENTKKQFKSLTDDYSGIYAFYIYDLNGNYFYGENYQEKMQAASLESQKGNLDINEYRSYLEAMGKRSDNQAFIKMVSILGKENINKAIINLGMSKTSLEENITTPEDIGLFFKKLKNYEILNKENTDEFLEFLTDTSFEKWLRPGIPSEIRLAHKYGREVHAVNDAGIVFSDKPFVLVIMTDGVVESEADKIFPELSKLLYNDQINEKTN